VEKRHLTTRNLPPAERMPALSVGDRHGLEVP
jgi:hypothetical protein